MFDLDKAIADWRGQLVAGGLRSAQVLDELESHLREDVEQQMRAGSSVQQAFEAAVQRMGQARTLKSEFAKVDRTKLALRKRLKGVLMGWMGVSNPPSGAFTRHEAQALHHGHVGTEHLFLGLIREGGGGGGARLEESWR